jgi:hypothetical protein
MLKKKKKRGKTIYVLKALILEISRKINNQEGQLITDLNLLL